MTRFKIVETIKKTNSGVGTVRAIFTTIDGEQCYAVQREGHAKFRRRSETAEAISGDLAAASWANGFATPKSGIRAQTGQNIISRARPEGCSSGVDYHSSFRAAEAEKKFREWQ
jgi:hypothetical protein